MLNWFWNVCLGTFTVLIFTSQHGVVPSSSHSCTFALSNSVKSEFRGTFERSTADESAVNRVAALIQTLCTLQTRRRCSSPDIHPHGAASVVVGRSKRVGLLLLQQPRWKTLAASIC